MLPAIQDYKTSHRKCDPIYTPREVSVCELIGNAGLFVIPVETDMITDYSTWWPAHYKKISISLQTMPFQRNERVHFCISEYHYFEYSQAKKGTIKSSAFIRTGGFKNLSRYLSSLKKKN